MNLHEYQAKQLFAEYGLPVTTGIAVDTADEAVQATKTLGGDTWVIKVQVHAGGRGKAGGVKLVSSEEEVRAFCKQHIGTNLVTFQTDASGQPVSKIYIEDCTDIETELYLGAVIDRSSQRVVFMASTEGGVEIEKVAEETPDKILKAVVDPALGGQAYQGRDMAFRLGLTGKLCLRHLQKCSSREIWLYLKLIHLWSPKQAIFIALTQRYQSMETRCTGKNLWHRCEIIARKTKEKIKLLNMI